MGKIGKLFRCMFRFTVPEIFTEAALRWDLTEEKWEHAACPRGDGKDTGQPGEVKLSLLPLQAAYGGLRAIKLEE